MSEFFKYVWTFCRESSKYYIIHMELRGYMFPYGTWNPTMATVTLSVKCNLNFLTHGTISTYATNRGDFGQFSAPAIFTLYKYFLGEMLFIVKFSTISIFYKMTFHCQNHCYNMFNRDANIQHTNLKVPLFGRGGISEDLKLILITIWHSASQIFVHLPRPSSNLVYRSHESTLNDTNFCCL